MMNPIFFLLLLLCDLAFWMILISVIFSWLLAFGILSMRSAVVAQISYGLDKMTEPIYRPIRRLIPTQFGGLDIAPIGALIAIQVIRYTIQWLSFNMGI